MNIQFSLIACLWFFFCMSASATELHIKGTVVAVPCTINSDTANKQIELPKTEARSMSEAGSGSNWVDFILELDNCPNYLTTAIATFSGTPDENDKNTYKNAGSADNVSLQMVARTTNYGNGSVMKATVDAMSHKAFFPLSARIYAPVGDAGKGTFSAVVGVDFTYQ